MGMYDSIECKCFLPMPDEPKGYTGSHGFQTKDFDCALDICRETEWVEGDPNAKGFLDKVGHIKTKKTWLESVNKTCTVQFYDFFSSNNTDYDYWIVYDAVFIDGKMKDIKLTTFEATPNSERKKKDIEFYKKCKNGTSLKKLAVINIYLIHIIRFLNLFVIKYTRLCAFYLVESGEYTTF